MNATPTPGTPPPHATAAACRSDIGRHPLLVIPFFRRWPRSIARDLCYTFIWNTGFAAAFAMVGMLFDPRTPFLEQFTSTLVFSQCIGFLIHFAFALVERFAPGIDATPNPRVRALYYAAVPLVCVIVGMWFASGIVGGEPLRTAIMQPRNLTAMSIVSLIISAVLLLIYIPRERAARAEAETAHESARVAAAERATTLAQMKLLEAQVEPHFLYNTLAHVDALIGSDPPLARRMLARLSEFLRATAASATTQGTLASQVAWTRAYLELVQMRMGGRLSWTIDVEPGLETMIVPPALLQPLVENAVKHGLEPMLEGGTLAIRARREGGMLHVAVDDTGRGFGAVAAGASTGIGLANLRARLATLFGARASLTIRDNAPHGASVALALPLP